MTIWFYVFATSTKWYCLNEVSFSQLHLSSGFINYIQSIYQGVEPTADHFNVSVTDGVHKSEPVPFYIVINPMNDETPSLFLHNFTVSHTFTSSACVIYYVAKDDQVNRFWI